MRVISQNEHIYDILMEIDRGNVDGYKIYHALGERENMGTPTTGEDIWRGNQLTTAGSGSAPTNNEIIPTPDSAGEAMSIVSENDADNGATATGALTVTIEYLDASGDEQTETVTLNGTTEVDTVATDIRFVNDMYVASVGSNGVAEGHIKIYKKGSAGLVYNMIAEGGNKSLVPHRMVPNGKIMHLAMWECSEGNNKRINMRIRATCDNYGVLVPGVFLFKGVVYVNQSTSGEIPLAYKIPSLAIVKVSGWATAINAETSCHWMGVLIDN